MNWLELVSTIVAHLNSLIGILNDQCIRVVTGPGRETRQFARRTYICSTKTRKGVYDFTPQIDFLRISMKSFLPAPCNPPILHLSQFKFTSRSTTIESLVAIGQQEFSILSPKILTFWHESRGVPKPKTPRSKLGSYVLVLTIAPNKYSVKTW